MDHAKAKSRALLCYILRFQNQMSHAPELGGLILGNNVQNAITQMGTQTVTEIKAESADQDPKGCEFKFIPKAQCK